MAATPVLSPAEEGRIALARLDRLPGWPLPWTQLAIIGIGYFFTFYDISDAGLALPAVTGQFKLGRPETLFVTVALGLAGYILGSIVIGGLSDRVGRCSMLLVTMAITALGSFGDAVSNGLVMLAGFRFLTGLGVGADLNLISTYVAELSPPAHRGRMTVLAFLVGILGQSVTPFVALALVPTFAGGWRLLFAIGGVIAVIALLARLQLPESPRWLVQHGQARRAGELIDRMEASARARGVELTEPDPSAAEDEGTAFSFGYLRRPPYFQRLCLLIAMWFLWYLGNGAFMSDAASLLADHGYRIAGSIAFVAIAAVGYPLGAGAMVVLADRVERKRLIFVATVVWLVGMVLVGVLAGPVLIAAGFFLGSLALGLYLQIAYTYTAESFPTRARSSGFAVSDGVGHLGGAVGALALPAVVAATSFQFGFIGIGVTGLTAGVLALAGPRVTGRRLEVVSG
ncbi:MAG: MFS transporter [Candidatus Dormibacteraeota bacterium]|nr:MFS transporter [Candidatus Dormibacteraeota bacterium]